MKERPLFIKIFVAFMLILFATVFGISVVFNYSFIKYSESEISKAGIGKLKVIQTANQMLEDNIQREALRLSLNSYLNNISLHINKAGKSERWNEMVNYSSILSVLDQVINANDVINSIYIYLEDAGEVISSRAGVEKIDRFYDTGWLKPYQENKKIGLNAFTMKTRDPINSEVARNEVLLFSLRIRNEKVVSYIFPLSIYMTPLNGAIIINISENTYGKLVKSNADEKEGSIFIINREGDVITHTDSTLVGENISDREYIGKIIESSPGEGYLLTRINGAKQVVTYFKPDRTGWIYIGAISLSSLMQKVVNLCVKISVVILVFSIIGFMGTYLVSKKLFNPVNRLIQSIRNSKAIDVLDSKNEVAILSRAFESLIKQEKKLSSLLESNKRNIRDKYLLDLVHGVIRKNSDPMLEVEFGFPFFACAILSIDGYRTFSESFTGEQHHYIKTVIIHICEDILAETFKCYGIDAEREKILLVINMENNSYKGNEMNLVQCFLRVQQEVAKILENTISVGIGSIYAEMENLKFSYSEALEAAGRRLISGCGSILEWKLSEHEATGRYYYPANPERLIIHCLSNGSASGVTGAVKELIRDIREKKEIKPDNVILIFNQLLGKIMEHLLSMNISVSSVFGENYNIYQQLSRRETIDEIERWLIEILNEIISFAEKRKASDKKYIDKALEYIHQNYKRDIDVNTMAEQVGVSYSQLRRVFVSELGVNLVNYVNNLRVDEAKRLLLQTDRNVMDIALCLGYNNDQSFNRFFKKFEGITPGEFRNKNKR